MRSASRAAQSATEQPGGLASALRAAVGRFDGLLRTVLGVHEFANDDRCLLRIAQARSDRDITLSDGTHLMKGELIGELHIWNEHVPPMPEDGVDLAWGLHFYSLMRHSLALLVQYLAVQPAWGSIRAWRGESSFAPGGVGVPELFSMMGFDVIGYEHPRSWTKRFVDFWDNLYWWVLVWTFNPASLQGKTFSKLERRQLWISSARLQQRNRDRKVLRQTAAPSTSHPQ